MNKAIILGRLVRDPEVKYTSTEKVVCLFTLAVDRPFKQDGEKATDYIPVVVWGKPAELAGNSLHKGHRVLIEGRIQVRSYEDKNGNKRTATEVIASNFDFIEKKSDAEKTQTAQQGSFDNMGKQMPFNENIPF